MDESNESSERELEQWQLSSIKQRKSRLQAKSIGTVVRRLMHQRGYGETQATHELETKWREIVGEPLASLTQPGKIQRGIMLVVARDHACLQELAFRRKQIVRELQAALPNAKVKDIRPQVGKLH